MAISFASSIHTFPGMSFGPLALVMHDNQPITPTNVNFTSLGQGLRSLIGSATGMLTVVAAGFFALLLGIACLGYAWNHNNPRKLQESRAAIMRVLEAAALFGLIGVLLGIVNTIVGFASHS